MKRAFHPVRRLIGRILDRLTLALLRRRLRARGVCSELFVDANAVVEGFAREQVASGRAENVRFAANLARQAALREFEACRGTTAVQ